MKGTAYCIFLALCGCYAYCEVLPTGKKNPFFEAITFPTFYIWLLLLK